jgi:hypothetical protein
MSDTLADLNPLIAEAMEEWQVPGLALAIVREGMPDRLKVYGQRDVEAGLPVTADTQFVLCSVTKSFTALGGQPTYRLAPYLDRTFKITELEGYRVEFQRGDSGAVDTIVFHQPNGTFSARRIPADSENL